MHLLHEAMLRTHWFHTSTSLRQPSPAGRNRS